MPGQKSNGRACVVAGCNNSEKKRYRWYNALCKTHNEPRRECGCSTYKLHRFPTDLQARKIWVCSVNRKDINEGTARKSSYAVCSKHFPDGQPSKNNPYPVLFMEYNGDEAPESDDDIYVPVARPKKKRSASVMEESYEELLEGERFSDPTGKRVIKKTQKLLTFEAEKLANKIRYGKKQVTFTSEAEFPEKRQLFVLLEKLKVDKQKYPLLSYDEITPGVEHLADGETPAIEHCESNVTVASPNLKDVTEPNLSKCTEQKVSERTELNMTEEAEFDNVSELAELDVSEHAGPAISEHIEPAISEHIEPDVSEHAEPAVSEHAEPVLSEHVEPVLSEHVEPVLSEHAEPDVTEHTEPGMSEHTEPEVSEHAEPDVSKHVLPDVSEHAEPDVSEHAEPDVTDHAEPNVSKRTESIEPNPSKAGIFYNPILIASSIPNIKTFSGSEKNLVKVQLRRIKIRPPKKRTKASKSEKPKIVEKPKMVEKPKIVEKLVSGEKAKSAEVSVTPKIRQPIKVIFKKPLTELEKNLALSRKIKKQLAKDFPKEKGAISKANVLILNKKPVTPKEKSAISKANVLILNKKPVTPKQKSVISKEKLVTSKEKSTPHVALKEKSKTSKVKSITSKEKYVSFDVESSMDIEDVEDIEEPEEWNEGVINPMLVEKDHSYGLKEGQKKPKSIHKILCDLPTTCDIQTKRNIIYRIVQEGLVAFPSLDDFETNNSYMLFEDDIENGGTKPELSLSQRLTEKSCRFCTGVPLCIFKGLASVLKDHAPRQVSAFDLRTEDQILMVFMKLRLGLINSDLAKRFNTSSVLCGKVFSAWIKVISGTLSHLIAWLPRESIIEILPDVFREHLSKVTCLIGSSEICIQRPPTEKQSVQTFSKDLDNVRKFIFAVAPDGFVMFVSKLYEGHIPGREMFHDCGIKEKLQPGDLVVASDEFTDIADLSSLDVLYEELPTSKSSTESKPWTTESFSAIQRLIDFKILKGVITVSLPNAIHVINTCSALCNLSISEEESVS